MNALKGYGPNGVQSQASWFVARLYSGEMSGKDESDLLAWLEADASHGRAYEEALALWDAARELRDDPELAAAAMGAAHEEQARRRAGWIAAAAAIVLAAAIAALTGDVFERSDIGNTLASYETAVGEQRSVLLSDGSRLTLNTGSRVLVDYTPNERRIILDFGEVFFEIEKDPARPLTVTARGRLLTVLGTSFSVMLVGNDVRVVIVEGVVAVSRERARFPLSDSGSSSFQDAADEETSSDTESRAGPDDVILRAGSVATFREGYEHVVEAGSDDLTRVEDWRAGVVRFDEEPLYAVVGELNRYSRTKILIEDEAIVNLRISGIFRLESVDLILDALQDVLPVRVVRYSDRYVLVGSHEDPTPAS